MGLTYSHMAGRAFAAKDGVIFFDTDAFPVQFYPTSEAITLTNYTISFPDLMKGDAYGFARGLAGSALKCACSSFVTIGAQDWGPFYMSPGPTSGHSLTAFIIGSVPGDTDILFCRAKLTRTVVPDPFNGNTIPTLIKEGKWVPFVGQDLPLEALGPFGRMFTLRLDTTVQPDGTKWIIAERRQSVKTKLYTYWNADNDETESGWTYGGDAGPYGHIVHLIESKGPSTDPSDLGTLYRRDSGSRCSLTDPTDFSSTFYGDIEIIPGRTGINAIDITGRPSVTLMDQAGPADVSGGVSVFTYTGMRFGPPHATRRIWVAAGAVRLPEGGGSTYSVTGIKIGGVAATLVTDRNTALSNAKFTLAWYYRDVPTGESGTVEVTYSSTMPNAGIYVFASYNLTNTVHYTVGAGYDATANLSTVVDGFALAIAMAGASSADFSGIENIERINLIPLTGGAPFFSGNQITDGTSIAMNISPNGLSTNESILAISIS